MKKTNLILTLLLISSGVIAQTTVEPAKQIIPEPNIGLSITELLVIALLFFAVVLLVVAVTLFNAFKVMLKEQKDPQPFIKYQKPEQLDYTEWLKLKRSTPNIWTKLLSLKPMEEEKNLEIPHAYDGIKELSNPVPAWFNVLFYGTIIFGAFYLYYYHIGGYGERQDDEYITEMTKADLDKKAFLAKSATKVDEGSIKIDAAQIVNGKGVFDANCIACHGNKGQGLVGPNLTDEFWLHGGSVVDVFKVVKYGVPEKGMVSWQKNLTSLQMSEVTNYIMSLKGTNPVGAKAPQGEKYEEKLAIDTANAEIITKN